MKKTLLFAVAATISTCTFAQIYMAKTCEISFFSKTPIEDIDATNKATKPFLNTATGEVQIRIVMMDFIFPKPLMQEHFNENYVESDKYPNAIFKGKINEKVDYTKDGDNKVTITGKLSIHGVEKDITIPGTLGIKGQEIKMTSEFKIKFADYKVVIPSLYQGVIPPETDVKMNAVLEPYKKN